MIMHSKDVASLPLLRAECEQAKSISLLYCHCPCMRVWAFCMLALIYLTAGQVAGIKHDTATGHEHGVCSHAAISRGIDVGTISAHWEPVIGPPHQNMCTSTSGCT